MEVFSFLCSSQKAKHRYSMRNCCIYYLSTKVTWLNDPFIVHGSVKKKCEQMLGSKQNWAPHHCRHTFTTRTVRLLEVMNLHWHLVIIQHPQSTVAFLLVLHVPCKWPNAEWQVPTLLWGSLMALKALCTWLVCPSLQALPTLFTLVLTPGWWSTS